jgi:hypothetical protein
MSNQTLYNDAKRAVDRLLAACPEPVAHQLITEIAASRPPTRKILADVIAGASGRRNPIAALMAQAAKYGVRPNAEGKIRKLDLDSSPAFRKLDPTRRIEFCERLKANNMFAGYSDE